MLTAPESKPKVKATAAENTIGMCDQDKAHIYIYIPKILHRENESGA